MVVLSEEWFKPHHRKSHTNAAQPAVGGFSYALFAIQWSERAQGIVKRLARAGFCDERTVQLPGAPYPTRPAAGRDSPVRIPQNSWASHPFYAQASSLTRLRLFGIRNIFE
jgi:hypothetical protein